MAKTKNPHDKHRITRRRLREWGYGYLFILPWIIGISVFFVWSMIQSLEYSFTNLVLDPMTGLRPEPLTNGLFENYLKVFQLETDLPTTLGSFAISLCCSCRLSLRSL